MNLLPILVGSDLSGGFNPNIGEPYRVIWNPQVMIGDLDRYAPALTGVGWKHALYNTAVLTDYDNEPNPVMSTYQDNPVDSALFGVPMILVNHGPFPSYPMLLAHIKDIADCDRTGKLPKVFQARFGCQHAFASVDVFRYNFGAADTRFVAVRLSQIENDKVTAGLILKLDASGPDEFVSPPVIISDVSISRITDVIRLVIYADKIEVRYGEPGDVIITHALDAPLSAEAGATFMPCRGNQPMPTGTPPHTYGIDGLYIYDGYF